MNKDELPVYGEGKRRVRPEKRECNVAMHITSTLTKNQIMLVIKENQREVLTIGGRKLGKEQEKRKKPTLQAKGKENIYEMCVKVTGT